MRVTRWGEFGILCCLYLSQSPEGSTVGAAEIAESQGIPLQYAQQILHRLKKGGIIKSIRGPKGGYALARPAHETTLRDILYAAEGDTFEVICETNPVSTERCGDESVCGLRPVWVELKSAVDALLQQKTLASIRDNVGAQAKANDFVQIHHPAKSQLN